MSRRPHLVGDIVWACRLERVPAAVEAALQAAIHMSPAPELQELLLQRSVLAHMVPLLLEYDPTTGPEEAAPQILTAPGDSAFRLPHIFQLPMQRSNVQVRGMRP